MIHPFAPYIPAHPRYLLLGSFVAFSQATDPNYNWYYSSLKNQFWLIMEQVYHKKLSTKKTKQKLFSQISIAVTDIIKKCDWKKANSSDSSLINITYNTQVINKIIKENPIQQIFFTSRFVEKEFKKNFSRLITHNPQLILTCLPSPSPRYASMSKMEKVKIYSSLLPKL